MQHKTGRGLPFLTASLLILAGCSENALEPTANLDTEAAQESTELAFSADFADEEAASKYRADWRRRGHAEYTVTVENLTGGQPFSPPIFATHRKPVALFGLGHPASTGIQQIAENGNNEPMRVRLNNSKHVADVAEGAAPLVPEANPGGAPFESSATYEITTATGAKYLSGAWMLICTNDGFSGIDGIRLPKQVGESTEVTTAGYDAGTEMNTEDFANIVPPCQGLIGIASDDPGIGMSEPGIAEQDVVRMHPGIGGGDDLDPSVHGWADPVARVTVTRVK